MQTKFLYTYFLFHHFNVQSILQVSPIYILE